MLRSTRGVALITLAMLNVFTLAAGVVLARMLPPRLALLKPVTWPPVLPFRPARYWVKPTGGTLPTSSGLSTALAGPLSSSVLGPGVAAVVADTAGQVVYARVTAARRRPRPPRRRSPPPSRPWTCSARALSSAPASSAARGTASCWWVAGIRRSPLPRHRHRTTRSPRRWKTSRPRRPVRSGRGTALASSSATTRPSLYRDRHGPGVARVVHHQRRCHADHLA